MNKIGISPDNFNPRVLYTFKRWYGPETVMSPHSHDFTTLVFVISGTCRYQIDDKIYRVNSGDTIICNPWSFHNKIVDKNEGVMEFHCAFNNIFVKNLPKDFILSEFSCPKSDLGIYKDEFASCIEKLIYYQEKNEPDCEIIIKSMVMRLIGIFLKATYIEKGAGKYEMESESGLDFESSDKSIIVKNIVSYIDANYMKELSLHKISQNIYLSPTYLSKIFKEEKGDSPINYLIKVRLSKARELLENEKVSIKYAAKSVGYDDAYYFSKLYKKYYGFPPSSLRQK